MAEQEWTGSGAQNPERLTGNVEGLTVWDRYPRGRNHPNQPEVDENFRDWMILTPNSMVDQFAVGGTVEDTVTPPNPTPPTNISYWGETPPNTPEYIASVPEQEYSMGEGVEVAERDEADEERAARAIVNDAGERQEPTKFAANLGGNAPEAAGTEDVQTMSYDASGETTPVEVPIAVSAGVVGYTEEPNATHPSNPDAEPIEPPVEPPIEGREAYDDEWEREDDDANTVEVDDEGNEKPRSSRGKKKGRRK